jgi:SynChlorMet cassette protein ScmC
MSQSIETPREERSGSEMNQVKPDRRDNDAGSRDGFALHLSDGRSWEILAADGAQDWVAEFAAIMGLEDRAEGLQRKILFGAVGNTRDRQLPPERVTPPWLSDLLRSEGRLMFRLPYMLLLHNPKSGNAVCGLDIHRERRHGQMYRALLPVLLDTIGCGGFPLHAALVERDGRGVLIAGRSGAGKSTACRRLPRPWRVLCDDTCLVVQSGSGFRVHPLPTWSVFHDGAVGQCWEISRSVPVHAVFFLEQSETDGHDELGEGAAAALLARSAKTVFCNTTSSKMDGKARLDLMGRIFENACRMAGAAPGYVLRASLHGRFWEEMEKALPPPGRG